MKTGIENRWRSVITWSIFARAGISAVFISLLFLVWNSSARLDQELKAGGSQYAAAHNLRVEYKNEVQEWKNVLLRSKDSAGLEKNWQVFENQYLKVADAANSVTLHSDVRSINVKMAAFIEAHKDNYAQYKRSVDVFVRHGFDFRLADESVKGIDRPLLAILDAVDMAVEEEKSNIVERLVAKSQNQIEQTLIALALMVLIVVWKPKI